MIEAPIHCANSTLVLVGLIEEKQDTNPFSSEVPLSRNLRQDKERTREKTKNLEAFVEKGVVVICTV